MNRSSVRELRDLNGQDLLELVQQEPVPEVDCPEQSRHSCVHQFNEYDLDHYNFEKLLEYPDCEACGCSLVVRTG